MQRKKVQIQSSDPSSLASDRYNLILADTNSDRLFTVNDVKGGGSKYGIINLCDLKMPSLKVYMHENFYFTNQKQETSLACCAVSGSLGPGPVLGL